MTPGDVVLLDFPYSDLSGSKFRPAVVLNVVRFADVVVCQVTTNQATGALVLSNNDLNHGQFTRPSFARPERLFTASRNVVGKKVGQLKTAKLEEVRDAVVMAVRGK